MLRGRPLRGDEAPTAKPPAPIAEERGARGAPPTHLRDDRTLGCLQQRALPTVALTDLEPALQRYSRVTGVPLEEAVRMVRSGRRTGPERRPKTRERDRRQLALL